MGDLYNINNNNYNACSSSSSSRDHHHNNRSSDEISHFLQQILLRSSSSTSSPSNSDKRVLVPPPAMMMQSFGDPLRPCPSMGVVKDGILGVDLFDHGGNVMMMGGSSSTGATTGASENENDDCDCESEEGLEGFMDGVPSKTTLPRNSSKRSRAAEVHNLSEKRRRSRINEKMKALQNLIPNSNKTDKASMLDEAIDYLKQLQLQVQMLSMRNGVSLHPMCLPGLLQPFQSSQSRTSFGGESGLRHMNLTASLPLNEDVTTQTMLRPPNQCPPSNQLLVPGMANMINSESTFGLESATHGNYGQFLHHQASSEGICRGDALPHQHLTSNHPGRDPSDFGIGVATATSSLPYGMRASNLRDALFLEPCMIGRDQNERVVLKIIEYNLILFPLTLIANNKTFALGVSPYSRLNYSPLAYDLFTSLHTGRSPRSDDTIKMERPANI